MKSRVSAETFVRAWQGASTIAAFTKTTGLKLSSARARARLYRRKGVKLKSFPRGMSPGAPPLDVAVLNKIAGEFKDGKRIAAKRVKRAKSKKRARKK